jgi:hypothetical protein
LLIAYIDVFKLPLRRLYVRMHLSHHTASTFDGVVPGDVVQRKASASASIKNRRRRALIPAPGSVLILSRSHPIFGFQDLRLEWREERFLPFPDWTLPNAMGARAYRIRGKKCDHCRYSFFAAAAYLLKQQRYR